MAPKLVDKSKRVDDIVNVARPLFSQKGYAATSVEQIATAAGIGKGTIYEYFQNKEDLFVASVMAWLTDGIARLEKMVDQITDPDERLIGFVDAMNDVFSLGDPDATRLFLELYKETLMSGGVFFKRRHLVKAIRDQVCRMVENIILEGISAHRFKAEIARDVDKIAANLMAFLDGAWIHYVITENMSEYETNVAFYMSHLVRSLSMDPDAEQKVDAALIQTRQVIER